jgi:recombination protein RecT
MESSLVQSSEYENYKKIMAYGRSPEVVKAFKEVLGAEAPMYIQSAITAVQSNPALHVCSPRSIYSAALRAATLRLSCDPAIGHAYIVPRRNHGKWEAQFQAGWRGIQHMALRTGQYQYINVSKVYDGEEIQEDRITGELSITGQPKIPKKDIGLIASFGLVNGYRKSIYMSYEELEAHGRRYSKSYGNPDSIWTTNKELAYHKTIVLKLLRTYGLLSPHELAVLESEDNEGIGEFDLPDDSTIVLEASQPKSIAEINKSLGYEDEDDDANVISVEEYKVDDGAIDAVIELSEEAETKLKKKTQVPPEDFMTLEDACAITDSKGRSYGELSAEALSYMSSSIGKALNNPSLSPEEKAEYQKRFRAIGILLKAKSEGVIN